MGWLGKMHLSKTARAVHSSGPFGSANSKWTRDSFELNFPIHRFCIADSLFLTKDQKKKTFATKSRIFSDYRIPLYLDNKKVTWKLESCNNVRTRLVK